MDSGATSQPSVFRSQTCDELDLSEFFVEHAQVSVSIFVDSKIHDAGLALWFFGQDCIATSKPWQSWASPAVQVALREYKDVDNVVGDVECWGGEIALFYSNCMMAAVNTT